MEKLSEKDVRHVANLARLNVLDSEIERYSNQLSSILSEIEKITKVDVTSEEILIAPTTNYNCYKEDEVGEMLSKSEMFANVPNAYGDYVVVPKVIND